MRKILIILTIVIHFLGNTEVSQLIRLPNLVQHYFEHFHIDRSINFFEYLSMHYMGDDGTDADNDRDQQLPCHDSDHNTLHILSFQITVESPSMPAVTFHHQQVFTEIFSAGLLPGHGRSLLRPPCTA